MIIRLLVVLNSVGYPFTFNVDIEKCSEDYSRMGRLIRKRRRQLCMNMENYRRMVKLIINKKRKSL